MVEYLTVGQILKPQGIKGELKIQPLTDNMARFDDLEFVFLEDRNGHNRIAIESTRYMGDNVILKLEGYDDRSAAEELRDHYIWIARDMAVKLPENTYFIGDIIGCVVYTQGDEVLGPIVDILHTGSNDVYVIDSDYGELLIPALKRVVLNVDIEEKIVKINTSEIEELISDEI